MARTAHYPARKVKLSAENIKDLLSGKGTRIDPHQIDTKDGHKIFVHPAQAHWLNRSKTAQMPIHLPPMNRKSMIQNLSGGSVFSDLIGNLSEKTKQDVTDKAHDLGKSGSNALLDRLQEIGDRQNLPKITKGLIEKVGKPLLEKLVRAGVGKITNAVVGKVPTPAKKGKGVRTPQRLYPSNQKPI